VGHAAHATAAHLRIVDGVGAHADHHAPSGRSEFSRGCHR
jgi:hypothetical protein